MGMGLTATWLAASGWTINNFLTKAAEALNGWGSIVVVILGLVAIIAAAYQIVTGLISHGKKQTSWPIVIALLLVGGIFVAIGMSTGLAGTDVGKIANGVGNEVNTMGQGTYEGKADGLNGGN